MEVIHHQNDLPKEVISPSNLELKIGHVPKTCAVLQHGLSTWREYQAKLSVWCGIDYNVHNSSFWPWKLLLMNYSISTESNFCVASLNTSRMHSPELYVSKRVELYVATSCSQSQALSVGHNPPAANCTKGLWKHTGVEGRKKMIPPVPPALFWTCPLSSVRTKKTSILFHKPSYCAWRSPKLNL